MLSLRKLIGGLLVAVLLGGSFERLSAQTRWHQMDVGPFFSATFTPKRAGVAGFTHKGIAIRLGREPGAAVCFDTELLRMSAGWEGPFVDFHRNREGLGGPPQIGAASLFSNYPVSGWVKDGEFHDPRKLPYGPMPAAMGKYKGLYRSAEGTVLSYEVAGVGILDLPGMERGGGVGVFTRSVEVGKAAHSLSMMVCSVAGARLKLAPAAGLEMVAFEKDGKLTLVAARGGKLSERTLTNKKNAPVIALEVPAGEQARKVKVFAWHGKKEQLAAVLTLVERSPAAADLAPLLKGGPALWGEPLVTKGVLGSGGAYVVDTLTPPFDNPWKAMLYFGGHDFFSNGDAAICSVYGDVWVVGGIDDKLERVTWRRFATGLFQPLGLRIVADRIYVLGRDQITRLHDLNGDGEADYYENFNNDCQVTSHGHEYTTNLQTDPAGNFYYMKCTNDSRSEHDGSVIRVSGDGKKFELFATGFRNPNGLGVGPDGTVTVGDQEGTWVPVTRLDFVRQGAFCGYMPSHHRATAPKTYDPPLCWIPKSVDNSAGGQAWAAPEGWGPLSGRLFHLSYGKCRALLVLSEEVDGQTQGGVVSMPWKFSGGAMRGRVNPADRRLYISGLKGWQTTSPRDGCFERVRYTGGKVYLPVALEVRKSGIRMTFSEPLDAESAASPESYGVERWNYRWTKNYGSKDWLFSDPKKMGRDRMAVSGVKLSADGRSVFLELSDLAPVMQMRIRYRLSSADGNKVRGEVFHTIHKLGSD